MYLYSTVVLLASCPAPATRIKTPRLRELCEPDGARTPAAAQVAGMEFELPPHRAQGPWASRQPSTRKPHLWARGLNSIAQDSARRAERDCPATVPLRVPVDGRPGQPLAAPFFTPWSPKRDSQPCPGPALVIPLRNFSPHQRISTLAPLPTSIRITPLRHNAVCRLPSEQVLASTDLTPLLVESCQLP